jgi:malonyl-CoA/methylmalonyl-CoA synthetase
MIDRADPLAWIDAVADADPDRPFLSEPGQPCLSYGALRTRTAQMAAALTGHDVGFGDRVTAQVEKSPEALILYLACLWIGAVYMPLNTGYTSAEIDYFVGDAQPSLFIIDLGAAAPKGVRSATLADLRGDAETGTGGRTILAPDTVAAMLYTSGTTGRPKGALLSRGALADNGVTLVQAWRFTRADVLLHALPIYHVHGLFVATNTVLAAGASMLFLDRFDPQMVIAAFPGITVMMGVPTHYTRLLAHSEALRRASSGVRLFISGSAPLLAETHQDFEAATGHRIVERYGMTETLINTSNPYDGPRVPGTVGPPLPGISVRVTDPASGTALPDGDIGMIEVKGPNLFSGYWRNPEKTAQEFRADGFFITGDLGKIDERGYVHIVGRGKDLIISGGLNIYPKEVETEINQLDGVIESAVVGVPHPDFGEAVVAIIVAAPGSVPDAAAITVQLAGRLARFKLPKRIMFTADLPRNAMGKVQKNLLRDHYCALFTG